MKIFLIGFMGSGKTTVAKELGVLLNHEVYDLDQYIEKQGGQTIAKLFEFGGERHFRQIEKKALGEILMKKSPYILACGGGTPCYFDNLEKMSETGIVLYLNPSPSLIFDRIKDTAAKRPLLQGYSPKELKEWMIQKLAEREEFYAQADLRIDIPDNELNVAEEISSYLTLHFGSAQ